MTSPSLSRDTPSPLVAAVHGGQGSQHREICQDMKGKDWRPSPLDGRGSRRNRGVGGQLLGPTWRLSAAAAEDRNAHAAVWGPHRQPVAAILRAGRGSQLLEDEDERRVFGEQHRPPGVGEDRNVLSVSVSVGGCAPSTVPGAVRIATSAASWAKCPG